MCPANTATGGPELLHQLAFELKKYNAKTFMLYVNASIENPVHENYKEYGVEYVYEVADKTENLVIFPEIYTEKITFYKNLKKIIWWLSVDNYFRSRPHFKGRFNRFILENFNYQGYFFFDNLVKSADFHLVQSSYAGDFLKKKRINNFSFLSDFLHNEFLNESTDLNQKENIVAYNPKKGTRFTKNLIRYAADVNFVPIHNMTRNEVVALLKRAKVYIDFGNHPGRDRIPREAAILYCCVITGKRGSAKYYEDVPIPESYKFEDKAKNYKAIREKIHACFEQYVSKNNEFENYRKSIKYQQSEFESAVRQIFIDLK
jgi:hypothetical protein